jgi:hypothetical protein
MIKKELGQASRKNWENQPELGKVNVNPNGLLLG